MFLNFKDGVSTMQAVQIFEKWNKEDKNNVTFFIVINENNQ